MSRWKLSMALGWATLRRENFETSKKGVRRPREACLRGVRRRLWTGRWCRRRRRLSRKLKGLSLRLLKSLGLLWRDRL